MHDALDQAEFYLRRSVDTDGFTLYRLFHQGLTDWLRQEPWESADGTAAEPAKVAAPLFEALTRTVVRPGYPGAWHSARPYLVRHASEHAADAGRLDDLLGDHEFLVYADPVRLAPHLHGASSLLARRAAAIHRASYLQHHRHGQVRREILAVDAARFGDPELARQLVGTSDWQVRWATGGRVSSALLATLTGHTRRVRAVAASSVEGRPAAVTADDDGTVRRWDLLTGNVTATLAGQSGWINGVGFDSPDPASAVLAAGEDGSVRVWGLKAARAEIMLEGHQDSVNAVTSAIVRDRAVVLTASSDETARVWDLATGRPCSASPNTPTR